MILTLLLSSLYRSGIRPQWETPPSAVGPICCFSCERGLSEDFKVAPIPATEVSRVPAALTALAPLLSGLPDVWFPNVTRQTRLYFLSSLSLSQTIKLLKFMRYTFPLVQKRWGFSPGIRSPLSISESVILNNARAPPLNPQIPSAIILHVIYMSKVQVLD